MLFASQRGLSSQRACRVWPLSFSCCSGLGGWRRQRGFEGLLHCEAPLWCRRWCQCPAATNSSIPVAALLLAMPCPFNCSSSLCGTGGSWWPTLASAALSASGAAGGWCSVGCPNATCKSVKQKVSCSSPPAPPRLCTPGMIWDPGIKLWRSSWIRMDQNAWQPSAKPSSACRPLQGGAGAAQWTRRAAGRGA